jgi:hypothetical protein
VSGQRRAAARAIGDHLVPAVEKAPVGHLPDAPPHAFDVAVMVGNIGVFHVQPVGNALGHVLPFAQIFPDALLALQDEGLDAVGFDIRLAGQPQRLFHLQLDGQAVGVPAGDAQHVFSLHGVVAGYQVLDGAGDDVADVRLAVGGRRSVIKGEPLAPVPMMEAFFHDPMLLPEISHLLFAADKVHVRCYLLIHMPSILKTVPCYRDGRKIRGTTRFGRISCPLQPDNGGQPQGITLDAPG